MSSSGFINVNLEGLSILDKIEEQGIAQKMDILRAIAAGKVGFKLVESFGISVTANTIILSENIKPTLPNSRVAVLFQLSWSGTEPDLKWRKQQGQLKSDGIVLSTLQASKVSGSDYQFDEIMSKPNEYNLIATQDCTLDYLIVIEYTMGQA